MWKRIDINSQKYLIKHSSFDDSYKIYFTNFENIWIEELSSVTLIERCKVQNPLIEAESQSLIKLILSLIDGTKDDVVFSSNVLQDSFYLKVKSKLADVPFTFTFNLKLMQPEQLYSEVTRPLLLLVQDLHTRQGALTNMLERKDAEISEYKLEGAQLRRKKMETEPFDLDKFVQNFFEVPFPTEVTEDPVSAFSHPLCQSLSAVASKYQSSQEKQQTISDNRSSEMKNEVINEPQPSPIDNKKESTESERQPEPTSVQLEKSVAKKRKTAPKPKLRL